MESSGSKRRRLLQSYVSLQRPDLPAIFESLNDDTLTTTLEFVGNNSYRAFGGLNKRCKEVYITSGMTKETFLYGYAPLSVIQDRVERGEQTDYLLHETGQVALSKGVVFFNRSDVLEWVLGQKTIFLREICVLAAHEERCDILNKGLDNIEDGFYKITIFSDVDRAAARGGKLKVLKWLETKGIYIRKDWCARYAARYGHLHILKWLREKKGLVFGGDLYENAIGGGHLHVLQWLREIEVPWDEDTFYFAVREEGNLNILQWLHDEGCPWTEYYRVDESELKPEVIDWCRTNGYGNRIQEE